MRKPDVFGGGESSRKRAIDTQYGPGEVAPGLEGRPGARPVVGGENPYGQIRFRESFLREKLAAILDSEALIDAAMQEKTDQENVDYLAMNREQMMALALRLARRARDRQESRPDPVAELAKKLKRNRPPAAPEAPSAK